MTDEQPNSPNPYQPPPIKSDASRGPTPGQTLALVALALLTIPAAGIACLSTCFVAVTAMERSGATPDTMIVTCLGLGGLVGLATLIGGVYLVVRLARSWRKANSAGEANHDKD